MNIRKEIEKDINEKKQKKVSADRMTAELENARQELSTSKSRLKALDWKPLQSLLDPTPAVVGVIEVAWTLLSDKVGTWDHYQKLMNKTKSDALFAFEPNTTSDLTLLYAKAIFEDVRSSLGETPQKFNITTEILYEWETAIFSIFDETRKILGTNADLEKKKNELYNCLIMLNKQRKKYEALKTERDVFTKYRNSLESKSSLLNELRELLVTEEELWKGLKEWQEPLEEAVSKQNTLIADSLFAAGVLIYFGPFAWSSREVIKKKWLKTFEEAGLKTRADPKVSVILGDPKVVSDWHDKNLLVEETSLENAFIINYWKKWPLIIDPEGAASKWIGKNELKDTTRYFKDDLAKKMSEHKPISIHITNEEPNPDLIQILELPVERTEKIKMIFESEKAKAEAQNDPFKSDTYYFEVSPKFSFAVRIEHAKAAFPDYMYELANVVNFTLSPKGLKDLFLIEYGNCIGSSDFAEIILAKKKSLEWDKLKQEETLLDRINQLVLTKIDEEDQRSLKDKIQEAMKDVIEIRKRIKTSIEEKSSEIRDKIQMATPLVEKISLVYQCTSRLTHMKPNYLFSYKLIKDKFVRDIRDNMEEISDSQLNVIQMKEAINRLANKLINSILTTIHQAVLKRDFAKFALYLAIFMAIQEKQFTKEEWLVFLYGENHVSENAIKNAVNNAMPKRISKGLWNALAYLESTLPDSYKGISQNIFADVESWETWAMNATPHIAALPAEIQSRKLKPLQILLLIRILCPEKMMTCMDWATSSVIGDSYLKITTSNIVDVFKRDTKINRPLLILADKMIDTTIEVAKFLHENVKFESWSLSKENESTIRRTLEECKRSIDNSEQWFFIKNINLIPNFGKYLVERLKEINITLEEERSTEDASDKWFRLILSCSPCRLPRELLNQSVKFAIDSPVTMKQTIIANLKAFQQQEEMLPNLKETSNTPANRDRLNIPYRRLTLSLSILHSVLNKRNIFDHRGWSAPFETSNGDLESESILTFNSLINYKEGMPWTGMRRMLADVWLGGRMVNDYDKMILRYFVNNYYNEELTKGNYAFVEKSLYQIPAQSVYEEMAKYIKNQPNEEEYSLCCMEQDITLTKERSILEAALGELKRIESTKENAIETAKDNNINEIIKLFEQIPETGFQKNDINPVIFEENKKLMLGHRIYLLQEMSRYNSSIDTIHRSLGTLKEYLKTGALMPPSIEKIYESLVREQVPEEFAGYPWNHPVGEWVKMYKARFEFILNWLKTGETKGYWIRALMYPKGLLNSLMLYFSQTLEVGVESLSLVTQITPYNNISDVTEVDQQICYLYGLYMVNAKHNGETNILDELTDEECSNCAGGLKYMKLPVISIMPTAEQNEESECFDCPVYYLPKKVNAVGTLDNYLMKVECLTPANTDFWAMKQVFISCTDPGINC